MLKILITESQFKRLVENIIQESSNYIILQRGQDGKVEDKWDFRILNGQHGEGIYSFLYGNKKMIDYYTKDGENLHTFKIPKKYLVNLSYKKWDYWDARKYIYNNPQYKAFMFKHSGYDIPTSKEILITDPSIIEIIK